MSRYVVNIIGPSGMDTTFLCRGKEVNVENATYYAHPSAAIVAGQNYSLRHGVIYRVIDTRDPERAV